MASWGPWNGNLLEFIALWLQRTLQIWTAAVTCWPEHWPLEPENSTESQLCHSLRVRMDKPSNFRFLTGLSWESEDVCVWMYFTRFQAWCKHERWLITFIRILTVTLKQREPAQEAECWNIFYMSSCLCHWDAAWLEQRKCSDFSNTDSFHTFKCQK